MSFLPSASLPQKKRVGPYQLDCHGPTVCVRKRWPLLSVRVRSSSSSSTTPLPSSCALYKAAARNDKIFFFKVDQKQLLLLPNNTTPLFMYRAAVRNNRIFLPGGFKILILPQRQHYSPSVLLIPRLTEILRKH